MDQVCVVYFATFWVKFKVIKACFLLRDTTVRIKMVKTKVVKVPNTLNM